MSLPILQFLSPNHGLADLRTVSYASDTDFSPSLCAMQRNIYQDWHMDFVRLLALWYPHASENSPRKVEVGSFDQSINQSINQSITQSVILVVIGHMPFKEMLTKKDKWFDRRTPINWVQSYAVKKRKCKNCLIPSRIKIGWICMVCITPT